MEIQLIQSKIHDIRGQRVMLDFDLAELYDVFTKVLNQAVKRNRVRFPEDFMFQLSLEEWQNMRPKSENPEEMWSQSVTTSNKFRRDTHIPYAFTEQGVAMLSSVLRSEKAIQVNIAIVRAFIAMRQYAHSLSVLSAKVGDLEKELADVNEVLHWLSQENQSRANEIAELQTTPKDWEGRRPIGF
jgi:glutamate mutase epsilon subunit